MMSEDSMSALLVITNSILDDIIVIKVIYFTIVY